ncbi:MAG: hypothetical protein LUQ66_12065 [Methanoregula sp.]|nr:hypothetical protein [Methanoregula sp.]
MDSRAVPVILILLLISLTTLAGCSSTTKVQSTVTPSQETGVVGTASTVVAESTIPVTTTQKENITGQLASVRSTNPVWLESYRMFRNIKSTEYIHPPYMDDDAAGVYKFDCLGFVDHVLMNATPDSYRKIGRGVNPSIESYATYFHTLDTAVPDSLGWTRVARPADLKPGDICLWLRPSTLDTGHMWIIAGIPSVNPKRTDEVLVRIFDSTGTGHGDDSRTGAAFRTGLGSGILGYMVDRDGQPVGLYWEGAASTGAGEKDTTIVCGRLNR